MGGCRENPQALGEQDIARAMILHPAASAVDAARCKTSRKRSARRSSGWARSASVRAARCRPAGQLIPPLLLCAFRSIAQSTVARAIECGTRPGSTGFTSAPDCPVRPFPLQLFLRESPAVGHDPAYGAIVRSQNRSAARISGMPRTASRRRRFMTERESGFIVAQAVDLSP